MKYGLPRPSAAIVIIFAVVVSLAARADAKNLKLRNFQAAEVVIGQPDFTSADPGLSASAIHFSYGNAWRASDVLFVPDFFNSRVLGFFGIPRPTARAQISFLDSRVSTTARRAATPTNSGGRSA